MLRRGRALPPIYPPLLILVLLGIGLRAWVSAAFSPAILNSADTDNYLLYAHTSLFSDPIHPAGYALYLKVIGWISSTAAPPIVLQHVIGIVTGLLAYATTVRVGAPRWVGAIPAGFVLLSLDQVALEHQYMPETLFTFLIVATAYCGVRGVMDARAVGRLAWPAAAWLAGAGAMLGLAAYVRTVALPMAPFLALWALLALPKPWLRARVVGAGVALAAVVVLALGYSIAHQIKSDYFGFVPGGGWAVYVRTAQFADCTKFTPPPGTRGLCESTLMRSAAV